MPIAKTQVDSISCEYSDFFVTKLVLGVIGSVFRRVLEGHKASFDSWEYKIAQQCVLFRKAPATRTRFHSETWDRTDATDTISRAKSGFKLH